LEGLYSGYKISHTRIVLSAYLPANFDPKRPLALIAGRGQYPIITAAAIRRAGIPLRLIAMDDETSPDLIASFPPSERISLNVGQVGKMLTALSNFQAGYAVMAGQVTPKKTVPWSHPRPQGGGDSFFPQTPQCGNHIWRDRH